MLPFLIFVFPLLLPYLFLLSPSCVPCHGGGRRKEGRKGAYVLSHSRLGSLVSLRQVWWRLGDARCQGAEVLNLLVLPPPPTPSFLMGALSPSYMLPAKSACQNLLSPLSRFHHPPPPPPFFFSFFSKIMSKQYQVNRRAYHSTRGLKTRRQGVDAKLRRR